MIRLAPAATAELTAVRCCSTRSGASVAGIRNTTSAPSNAERISFAAE